MNLIFFTPTYLFMIFQMPTTALNHEQCRARNCFLCLAKIKRGQELPITDEFKRYINEEIYTSFYEDEAYLPCSLCPNCTRILYSVLHAVAAAASGAGAKPRKLPPRQNWRGFAQELRALPPATRNSVKCKCESCLLARMTFNIRPSVYYVAAPVEPKPEEPNPLCPKCFKPIFQGKSHKCPSKYKTKRFKNVVENISPEGLKQLQVYVNDKVGGYIAVEKVKISSLSCL